MSKLYCKIYHSAEDGEIKSKEGEMFTILDPDFNIKLWVTRNCEGCNQILFKDSKVIAMFDDRAEEYWIKG